MSVIALQEERKVWLEYHKRKWKLQAEERRERKRRRIDFGDMSSHTSVTSSSRGIGGFLRRTARSVMDMPWQIVQVRLGVFYQDYSDGQKYLLFSGKISKNQFVPFTGIIILFLSSLVFC